MRILFIVLLSSVYLFLPETHAGSILKGSVASLIKQNIEADQSNLTRIANAAELKQFKDLGLLVPIPQTPGVIIDPRLDTQYRLVRPWTAKFLSKLGKSFKKRFGTNLQVNSAVRTIERQEEIARSNKNAAPTEGDTRSSHLTGASVDIAKKPLTSTQRRWLRAQLKSLERNDLIEATEEHYQAVFHIMVFRRYESTKVRVASK